MRRAGAAPLMAAMVLASGAFAWAGSAPEPAGYRMDEYKAPVPATLQGATVVATRDVEKLLAGGSVILVDVMPHTPKPDKLPAGTIWRDKERKNIEGSVWLPNTGYGALSVDTQSYFDKSLAALSANNKSKTVLFYCMTDCWMSWNAAKRAVQQGYTSVLWYPDGADGWEKAGHTLVVATPYPAPN